MGRGVSVTIKLLIKYPSNFRTTDVELKFKNLSTVAEAYTQICRCLDYFKGYGTSVDECSIIDTALNYVVAAHCKKKRLEYTLDDYLKLRCLTKLKSVSDFRFSANIVEFN